MSIRTAAAALVAVLGFATSAHAEWSCSYVQVLNAPNAPTTNGDASVELDYDDNHRLIEGTVWWSISSTRPASPHLMFELPVDTAGRWSWRPDRVNVMIEASEFHNGDETFELSLDDRLLYKGPASSPVMSSRGKAFDSRIPADAPALAAAVKATKVRVRLLSKNGAVIYDETVGLPAVAARDAVIRPGVAWASGGLGNPDVCEEI